MEADRVMEERATQSTGMVHLPGHLQYGGHFADHLYPGIPEGPGGADDGVSPEVMRGREAGIP